MSGMRMTTAGAAAGVLGLLLTAGVTGARRLRGGGGNERLPSRLAGHGREWLDHTFETGRRTGAETAQRFGSAARRLERLRGSVAAGLPYGTARGSLRLLRWIAAAALFGVVLQALDAERDRRPRPARPRWARRRRRRAAVHAAARRAAAHVAFGAVTAAAYELLSDRRP